MNLYARSWLKKEELPEDTLHNSFTVKFGGDLESDEQPRYLSTVKEEEEPDYTCTL